MNRPATPPSTDVQGAGHRRERVRRAYSLLVGQHCLPPDGRRPRGAALARVAVEGIGHERVSDQVNLFAGSGSYALVTSASCAPSADGGSSATNRLRKELLCAPGLQTQGMPTVHQ